MQQLEQSKKENIQNNNIQWPMKNCNKNTIIDIFVTGKLVTSVYLDL